MALEGKLPGEFLLCGDVAIRYIEFPFPSRGGYGGLWNTLSLLPRSLSFLTSSWQHLACFAEETFLRKKAAFIKQGAHEAGE